MQTITVWTGQQIVARYNLRFLFTAWWIGLTIAAFLQIVFWPEKENQLCVLLAWAACMLTGRAVMRSWVTVSHPWSSMLVLMFCLTNLGFPLILLTVQGDPLAAGLEVPTQTYFHLFVCQLVMLIIHYIYRKLAFFKVVGRIIRNRVLSPLGFLYKPNTAEVFFIGIIGMVASAYVYCYLRAVQVNANAVTGSIVDKTIAGFIPLVYAPYLLLLYKNSISHNERRIRRMAVALYTIPIFVIALAFNARCYGFIAVATISITAVLMLFSGEIKMPATKTMLLWGIILLLLLTIGSDLSIAMREARNDREAKSSEELVTETLRYMTTDRAALNTLRSQISSGEDDDEAWYVTSPIFSRLVYTHFQDKALAIGLGLSAHDSETIRRIEIEKILITLPNPVLKLCQIPVNKDEVGVNSMGDWMSYLGGRQTAYQMGGNGSGGFIGDGYCAYGWGYLLPFGCVAILIFLFSDSLYGDSVVMANGENSGTKNFAIIGLIYSYPMAIFLNNDSISGLISFLMRQPLQWLILYGIVLFVARPLIRLIFGKFI